MLFHFLLYFLFLFLFFGYCNFGREHKKKNGRVRALYIIFFRQSINKNFLPISVRHNVMLLKEMYNNKHISMNMGFSSVVRCCDMANAQAAACTLTYIIFIASISAILLSIAASNSPTVGIQRKRNHFSQTGQLMASKFYCCLCCHCRCRCCCCLYICSQSFHRNSTLSCMSAFGTEANVIKKEMF